MQEPFQPVTGSRFLRMRFHCTLVGEVPVMCAQHFVAIFQLYRNRIRVPCRSMNYIQKILNWKKGTTKRNSNRKEQKRNSK